MAIHWGCKKRRKRAAMSNEPLKLSSSHLGRQGAHTYKLRARHLCIIFGQEEERVRIASSSSPQMTQFKWQGRMAGQERMRWSRAQTAWHSRADRPIRGDSRLIMLHSGQARPSGSALAARGGGERRRDGNDVLCQGKKDSCCPSFQ